MVNKILKLSSIFLILTLTFSVPTFASYSDQETSSTNFASSSTLDVLITGADNVDLTGPVFDEAEIDPDTDITSEFTIHKVGALNTTYNIEMVNTSGDSALCTSLNVSMQIDNVEVYSGNLVNLDNEEVNLSGDYDDVELTVSIENEANLQNKTCNFDIQLNSWQSTLSMGLGFEDTEVIENNEIYTNGWIPYVILTSPVGGNAVSFVSGEDIEITWEATSTGNLPDNTLFIQLLYSEDGGANFVEFAFLPTNLGTYTWTTPQSLSSNEVVLKVSAFNFDPFLMEDTNDPFTIAPAYSTNDIVINELFWSGSTASTADEWVELYNSTANTINLTGWTLEGAGSGSEAIELSGSLDSGNYFLLSNYVSSSSAIADSIDSTQVDSSLNLNNSGEQLVLKDLHGNTIDLTPVGSWAAGENGSNKVSMQRNVTPGIGSDSSSWFSCLVVECNSDTFWDVDNGLDFGTPKAPNL